jgi:site-specific DNA recombinase
MTTNSRRRTLEERPETVKRVRVYFRQSKELDHQKESVVVQRAECERLARALGLADLWASRIEYQDVDRAGDDFAGREALARLLAEAQPGDVVLAWKQDRIGRDMIDSASAIRELVKFRRCEFYAAETGTAPVTFDSAEQTTMVLLRGMIAQGELERIRSRVRDGLRERARNGFASGYVPYGYRTVAVDPKVKDWKQTKKRIEIDPTEAAIVRRIYDMYELGGLGYCAIAKALNADGAPSPKGKGFTAQGVRDILMSPRYVGEWTHGVRRVVRREGKREIRERANDKDVIRISRPDLAIVSQEQWARVQTLLAKRSIPMNVPAAKHPLTGLLRCGECGKAMSIRHSKSDKTNWFRRYYICKNRVTTGRCGNKGHLRADEVESALFNLIRTEVVDKAQDQIRAAIRAELARAIEVSADNGERIAQLREEIDSLRRERQRLVKLAAATDQPVDELVTALRANQERSRALDHALAIASRPPIDPEQGSRLEAEALGHVQALVSQVSSPNVRNALRALFPNGLRFTAANDLWRIEGVASVPMPSTSVGVRRIRMWYRSAKTLPVRPSTRLIARAIRMASA